MNQTIVLIHGFGFDDRIWSPIELAFEGYHVLSLSLPGFGDEAIEGPYTIQQLAQRYWSEIDLNIAPEVHLVGHSMGGYVGIEMAAQRPSRVKSLALIHSHVFADSEEKKLARTATMHEIKTSGRAAFVHKMISSLISEGKEFNEIIESLIRRGLKYDDLAWYYGIQAIRDRMDHAETLKNLNVPVLMIMGEKDNAVPIELAYKQAKLSERTNLLIYNGVGHLAMYENTARMICDLAGFYSSIKV